MSKTNFFPAWLPCLGAWIRALKLAIPAYFGATVVFVFEFWRYLLGGIILVITGSEGSLIFLTIAVAALFLALIWFLILVGIYRILLKVLWSKPPNWISPPMLVTLMIRDFGVLFLSVLPVAVAFSIYILFVPNPEYIFADLKTPRLTYDVFLLKFSWLWFISAACLYNLFLKKASKNSNR